MHSRNIIDVGPDVATAGPVGLAQGVYGARGNLELVACGAEEGLWVFWFNADDPDDAVTTPDVPPGTWSAGLGFAPGIRYLDAQIAQSALGPDHLEVLALTADHVLQSWYWSPGPGFRRRPVDAALGVARFRLAHDAGELRVAVQRTDGASATVSSPTVGYPDRYWHESEGSPTLDDDTALAMLAAHGILHAEPRTARSARSTRDGGTTELTWRGADGIIRHLGIPD
ncbi:hypothetical protein [Microbacterium sp. 1.5R]|uniref:hypothetical protein n=1 Tax=Microbacterium sp. 1.5R TaxID=1916917 RepID=UPI0011A63B8F|nr:hypothetical protein [Microbacterium sp. 1.5R]